MLKMAYLNVNVFILLLKFIVVRYCVGNIFQEIITYIYCDDWS